MGDADKGVPSSSPIIAIKQTFKPIKQTAGGSLINNVLSESLCSFKDGAQRVYILANRATHTHRANFFKLKTQDKRDKLIATAKKLWVSWVRPFRYIQALTMV